METQIRKYLSQIGKKGGLKSRRTLSSADAKMMTKVREARKAFRKYYSSCFWHLKPDLEITKDNINVVIKGLKNNGDRQAFFLASKLCR